MLSLLLVAAYKGGSGQQYGAALLMPKLNVLSEILLLKPTKLSKSHYLWMSSLDICPNLYPELHSLLTDGTVDISISANFSFWTKT
jgi:hypothetical protein